MRLASLSFALAATAALSSTAAAQTDPQRPRGCRGTNTTTSTVSAQHPLSGERVQFTSYPVIETVQPGSPAERGGIRAGDRILIQDGRDVVGQELARVPLAGDTVTYVVDREGRQLQVTVVMGRWEPAEETPGVERTCVPVAP
jgi:S1-C subfamily serine protease